MMNEEKLLTVARYLEGDMEPQEKQEFETLLQSDAELQELKAYYINVHQSLKMNIAPDETDQQVAATLATLGKQHFKNEATEQPSPRVVSLQPYIKWLSVAAVLIIGLLVWAPWSANLYEKYTISKEMSVVERSDNGQNTLEKAADFYNAHDYASAEKLLQEVYKQEQANSLAAYYYGITLIETGKGDEARAVLSKLYDGESVFKFDAAYYIALSYVKQKDNSQALSWLSKIPQGSTNYDKAKELSTKLR
ncbi:tetratricopeptide repeat protein [Pedobacter nyackensis]|uniref:Tetratricopeptide repeat-containing protein n=1 Tax=Pedobacter nyackensis TaxID=475255 RepID=A0A1W2DP22_9SPHI|nr:tetratricopeptide repeat protein [Pedobacter nyackensis]SMC98758.1 Tetratricopeptide repeat-containing protein [Pedobacter nyackensis]